jgi:hypothetical protein
MTRCESCGEVHWSLGIGARKTPAQECRICGAALRPERRRPGRRFSSALAAERRDVRPTAPS